MATENTSPIHKRLFGYCSEVNEETGKTNVDVTSIAQKLILFDAYILMSIRLSEIPQLIRTFGFDGLVTLLKSNSLRISCSAIAVAERGNMYTAPQCQDHKVTKIRWKGKYDRIYVIACLRRLWGSLLDWDKFGAF